MRRQGSIVRALFAAPAAALILLLAVSAGPGGSAQQQEAPLRHEASAIVKLVPVRVVDAQGRPVRDLRKEDFTLYEDGERKVITEFEVHSIDEEAAGSVSQKPGAAQPRPALGRKFFLFLDVQRTDPPGRQKALAVAERFLDNEIRPGDEVAVLGFYSMSGFFIKEYLTKDLARVRQALASLTETEPSPGEVITIGFGSAEGRHVPGTAPPEIPGAGLSVQVFIPGTRASARTDFADRMKEMAEIFKGIPGNKNLVLFSSRRVGPEIGRLFGATGTAIFAVNTQDWMMLRTGDKVKHIWWDHPLKELAAASGGKYFADPNQTAAIAQGLKELTGSFYVLGYYVKESWEGKFHGLKVEVDRADARVLVQEGYADPKPFARMTDFEKDIQLVDLLWSDERAPSAMPLDLSALTVETGAGIQACLLGRLDVGTEAGPAASKSEVAVLLRGRAGAQILSRRWTVDLAPYDRTAVFPYLITAVPAGNYEARLVVRDLATGEASVGTASFEAAAPAPDNLCLFSPIVLEPGSEAQYLGLSIAGKEKGAGEFRSLADLYRLIPKGHRPVVSELAAGEKRLMIILPLGRPAVLDEEPPILSLSAEIVSRTDGLRTSLGTSVREHRALAGRPEILVVEIVIPALPAGAYDLELSALELDSGRRSVVVKPLVLR